MYNVKKCEMKCESKIGQSQKEILNLEMEIQHLENEKKALLNVNIVEIVGLP